MRHCSSTARMVTVSAILATVLVMLAMQPCVGADGPTDGCCATCIGKPTAGGYTYDPVIYEQCSSVGGGICCFNCGVEELGQPTVENAKYVDGITPQVPVGAWIQFSWANVVRVTYETYQSTQIKTSTVRNNSQSATAKDDVFFICAKQAGRVVVRGWGEDPCLTTSIEFTINITTADGSAASQETCAESGPTAPPSTTKRDSTSVEQNDKDDTEASSPAIECNQQRASITKVDGEDTCVCAAEWTGPPDCSGYPWWKIAATIGGAVAALLSIAVSARAFLSARKAKKEAAAAAAKGSDEPSLRDHSITLIGCATTSKHPYAQPSPQPRTPVQPPHRQEYTL